MWTRPLTTAFSFKRSPNSQIACTYRDPAGLGFVGDRATTTRDQVLSSVAPLTRLSWADQKKFWFLAAIMAAALCALVWAAVRWSFLEAASRPRDSSMGADLARRISSGESHVDRRALLLRFRLPDLDTKQWCVIDPAEVRTATSAAELIKRIKRSDKKRILLRRFDYGLSEPAIRRRKLELLERLSAWTLDDHVVVIESGIEPLFSIAAQLEEASNEGDRNECLYERWAFALQPYLRLRTKWTCEDAPRKPTPEAVAETGADQPASETRPFLREGLPNEWLKQLSAVIGGLKPPEMTDNQEYEAYGDMAQAHYRRIWMSCSTVEKLLLYRVATDGFVNPQRRRGAEAAGPSRSGRHGPELPHHERELPPLRRGRRAATGSSRAGSGKAARARGRSSEPR